MDYQIVSVIPQDKKKLEICLDNGETFVVYKGEAARLSLFENEVLDDEKYQYITKEILGKRATKRALHLLEKQERTEKQLRDKLIQSGYPDSCVEQAIEYVRSYHYVDDYRYASVYIRYHQEKESRQKITQKLLMRGIKREIIQQALEEEFFSDECIQIENLMKKRHFEPDNADEAEQRKMIQYLLRRGFKSSDVFKVLRQADSVRDEFY